MNDVKFDLNSIYFLEKPSREIEARTSECAYSFDKRCASTEEEKVKFIDECRKEIKTVQDGIIKLQFQIKEIAQLKRDAIAKKEEELPCPPPPSVPSECSESQRNDIMTAHNQRVREVNEKNAEIREKNEQIDSYAQRCDEAIEKTEEIIIRLKAIDERIKRECDEVRATLEELSFKAFDIKNKNRYIVSSTASFNYAMGKVYEMAERIEMMNAHSLGGGYDVSKQFVIRNTHSHEAGASVFGGTAAVDSYVSSTENVIKDEVSEDRSRAEITVNERNADAFFEKISGYKRIEMPSGNIRFLGGKAFNAKMNELGYKLTAQADGTVIDKNRMVHWEKI